MAAIRRYALQRITVNRCHTSGHHKPEQERSACAAFLRGLGVPFLVEELESVTRDQDPPDIMFRTGRFEVCEVINPNYKRHDEARDLARQAQQAQTINDVLLPRHDEKGPLSLAEAYNLVTEALAKKCARRTYRPAEVRAGLDALVCIQLLDKFLRPALPLPPHDALLKQGWCSVSLIMPPYSHMIHALDSAPTFLTEHRGQTRKAWPDRLCDKLFALDPALDPDRNVC